MKHLIAALFAGTLALSSMSALSAEPGKDQVITEPAQGDTKTEKAKDYVKKKAHNTKVKTKRAAKKTKAKVSEAVRDRKTMDPASPNESKPEAPPKR
jgi:hypothetical protein